MASKNGSIKGKFNLTTPNTASGIWDLTDVGTKSSDFAWPGVVIPGGQAYNTPGTYSWIAPTNVTSISIVAIGGGSAGIYGGAGGGLGYKNNITVTPGTSYTVVVGAGGAGTTAYPGNPGGSSYITVGGTNYGATGGGGSYTPGSSLNGDGGGSGGGQPGFGNGAGGGAGGYNGGGGGGSDPRFNTSGGAGVNGGGGGGGQENSGAQGGAGGGASVYGGNGGQGGTVGGGAGGAGGTGPVPSNPAGGNASGVLGGFYGGGAAGGTTGNSGSGAVRIIWPGTTRQFPSTNINIINETQLLTPSAPVNVTLPTISGTAAIGQTLTVTSVGTWTGNPTPTYSYQWQRGSGNISGATSNTYTITASDSGFTIRCQITATNFVASTSAASLPTTSIAGATVVTNGLVVYLDAGNSASYSGSGSTWYDLSGNSNHMTLINSPSYSSSSGGVIQFNGSNQYADLNLNYSTSTFTIMGASRYSGSPRGRIITAINNNWLLGHWASSTQKYYAEGWITNSSSGETNDTNWRIYTATENYPSDLRSMYVNNTAYITNSNGGSQGFNGLRLGQQYSEYSASEVGFILVYNRILTQAEMTQNYNFFASRYGLPLSGQTGVNFAASENGAGIGTSLANGSNTTDAYFGPSAYSLSMSTSGNWTAVGAIFCNDNINSTARSNKGSHNGSTFSGGGSSGSPFEIVINLNDLRTFNKAYYYQMFSDGKTTHARLFYTTSSTLITRTDSNWILAHDWVLLGNSGSSFDASSAFGAVSSRFVKLQIYNDGRYGSGSYTELYNFKLFFE